eukprot:scaffold121567_cov69-Phaeocystis_antarctica.AAC.1
MDRMRSCDVGVLDRTVILESLIRTFPFLVWYFLARACAISWMICQLSLPSTAVRAIFVTARPFGFSSRVPAFGDWDLGEDL